MDKVIFKKSQENHPINLLNRSIGMVDWAVFFIIAIFCYLFFLHGDILCTAGSSISYLGGHITDFYEYNPENGVEIMNNYLPSTYILFAIWNIPIYLLDLVSCPVSFVEGVSLFVKMWYKALPVIFFIASGFLVFKIGEVLGLGFKKSKLLMFVFYTTPVAFFSPLIFGQYDSFTIFFVLLGTYYYFKDKAFKFVLFFGIAMTFKYFALLIFVPLLLLREKKILKIFLYSFLFLFPLSLEVLFYSDSKNFNIGVLGFKAANYLFKGELNLKYIHPSLFLIGWVFVLIFSYMKKFDSKDKTEFFRFAIYICNVVAFLTFGFSMWHPQWLIFMAPFLAMGAVINKNARLFFILDTVMFLVFVLLCVNLWRGSVDEHLLEKGFLGNFFNFDANLIYSITDFIPGSGIDFCNWLFSCFFALLLAGAVFKHPKFTLLNFKEDLKDCGLVLRVRMASIVLFWVFPCIFCVFVSASTKNSFFVKNTNYVANNGSVGLLTKRRDISQIFTVPENINSLEELRVSFNTANRKNDCSIKISIVDLDENKTLFSEEYETYKFNNIIPTKFKLHGVRVLNGKRYSVNFKMLDEEKENALTINKTLSMGDKKYRDLRKLNVVYGGEFSVVDEGKQKFNLSLDLLGKYV